MSSGDRFPQGGDINDMATSGTTVPEDSAAPRIIKSVPNPGLERQIQDGDYNDSGDLAGAATNATDIPRSVGDSAATGEVDTLTGNSVGGAVESKRLHTSAGNSDLAKGSLRMEKHARNEGSELDKLQGDGPNVEAAPGEEELSQEELRNRRDGGA